MRDAALELIDAGQRVAAPAEFPEQFYSLDTYPSTLFLPPAWFDAVVLHKGKLEPVPRHALTYWVDNYHPYIANEVFILLTRDYREPTFDDENHYKALLGNVRDLEPVPVPEEHALSGDVQTRERYDNAIAAIKPLLQGPNSIAAPQSFLDAARSHIPDLVPTDRDPDLVVIDFMELHTLTDIDPRNIARRYHPIVEDNALVIYAKPGAAIEAQPTGSAEALKQLINSDSFPHAVSAYNLVLKSRNLEDFQLRNQID